MAAAIAAALDQVPDRRSLMQRGLNYTAERAATRFLEIAGELAPWPTRAQRTVAVADVS